ncbi:MAG: antitoxin [Clostridiales bacterium]|nr:antitoxin [Clostridiales bacterium]
MEKKKYASNTRAKNKWNAENYDRLYPYVKKGKKEKYLAAAQAAGMSLNEWLEKTLDAAAGIGENQEDRA